MCCVERGSVSELVGAALPAPSRFTIHLSARRRPGRPPATLLSVLIHKMQQVFSRWGARTAYRRAVSAAAVHNRCAAGGRGPPLRRGA